MTGVVVASEMATVVVVGSAVILGLRRHLAPRTSRPPRHQRHGCAVGAMMAPIVTPGAAHGVRRAELLRLCARISGLDP